MHPRNPYLVPPDFSQLAESYPLLKPFVYINNQGQPSINFKDVAGQRYLTEALLHRDFGLRVEIPQDRLCPAVPNRLNYVLWIQDVLAATSSPADPTARSDRVVHGIDVGTGASVIYPLLACALSANWSFVATDVDHKSLVAAEKNIANNGFQNRILLAQVSPTGPLFRHLFEDNVITSDCDFLMCNPPFYGSKEDVTKAAEDKEFDPSAICTGADVEMVTAGGEVGFVKRIIEESILVGGRCRFYTSLLGKHSSIAVVVGHLRSLEIDNYGLTEFIQGHTRRWGIIWSLAEERIPDALIRSTSESLHALLPLPNTLRQRYPSVTFESHKTLEHTLKSLVELCNELEGVTFAHIHLPPPPSELHEAYEMVAMVSARENTWSRKARRRLEKLRKETGEGTPYVPPNSAALGNTGDSAVSLTTRCFFSADEKSSKSRDGGGAAASLVLEASWTKGKDRELFESFWSHLSRKLGDRVVGNVS